MDSPTVTRAIRIPDPVRLARYRDAPELGARLLFFSGGSALRGFSRELIRYTHHSRHLITPFDSGGSSAVLRDAFRMPAIGDLRNRLMALADQSVLGNPEIYDLFALRFPQDRRQAELRGLLNRMARGVADEVRAIPEPMRSIIRSHLAFFREAMPLDFDLRGAAIGNLILAGGYLNQSRQLDPVVYLFSQLVEVRGVVRAVVDDHLHLVAELEDGRRIVGQHLITGLNDGTDDVKIKEIFLTRSRKSPKPCRPRIAPSIDALIRSADLICYPVGSFYTSLIATLLPDGVSDAIASTVVPKVYVPNAGYDPEEAGLSLVDKVDTLIRYLSAVASKGVTPSDLLGFVLVDREAEPMPARDVTRLSRMGIQLIEAPLISADRAPLLDEALLAEALLSLV